jgi:hypothetical protein
VRIGAPTEEIEDEPSPCVLAGLPPRFANAGVISGQLKLDLGVRQETQTATDLLRDGDLSLAGDLRGNTPTGKCNTGRSGVAT